MTPLEIRASLVALGSEFIPSSKVKQLEDLLTIKGTPNGGIGVTDDLKYNGTFRHYADLLSSFHYKSSLLIGSDLVKYSRANSIHVSPTALWDGLVANEVSSSFGKAEWEGFLEKRVI